MALPTVGWEGQQNVVAGRDEATIGCVGGKRCRPQRGMAGRPGRCAGVNSRAGHAVRWLIALLAYNEGPHGAAREGGEYTIAVAHCPS